MRFIQGNSEEFCRYFKKISTVRTAKSSDYCESSSFFWEAHAFC